MSLHLLLSNTFKFVWLSNLSMFSVLGERYSKMTFYTLNIRLLLHNIYVKNTAFYEGIREPQIVVKRNLTWPTTDNGSTDTKLDHNSPICVRVYLHVYIYICVCHNYNMFLLYHSSDVSPSHFLSFFSQRIHLCKIIPPTTSGSGHTCWYYYCQQLVLLKRSWSSLIVSILDMLELILGNIKNFFICSTETGNVFSDRMLIWSQYYSLPKIWRKRVINQTVIDVMTIRTYTLSIKMSSLRQRKYGVVR